MSLSTGTMKKEYPIMAVMAYLFPFPLNARDTSRHENGRTSEGKSCHTVLGAGAILCMSAATLRAGLPDILATR